MSDKKSLEPSNSSDTDLEKITLSNTTEDTVKTSLLTTNDKTKIATNCCVYSCELLLGLLCCFKL